MGDVVRFRPKNIPPHEVLEECMKHDLDIVLVIGKKDGELGYYTSDCTAEAVFDLIDAFEKYVCEEQT